MQRNSAKILRDGVPRSWIGVNFWSRTGGPLMWRSYDGGVVAEELEQLRDHGIGLTRSFCYWPDFQPEPHRLDETMLDRFGDFLDRHHALGMQTIPTFIVGHMSGENWDPAWRNGRDLFGDVWFVARTAWYIREFVTRFHAHPAIAGWLLTNEIPIYADWRTGGVGTVDSEQVASWAQLLIDAVRLGGGTQPVSVGEGAWGIEVTGRQNGFRVRDLEPLIDFFGPHVYRMEDDVVRQHLGAAFICELLDLGGKPVVLEEFGVTSDYVAEDHAAHYYRQQLTNTLLAGATGWIAWNNVDYDRLDHQRPYSHHPFELHFGLVDSDGRPKAQLREIRRFAELLERVDSTRLSRPDTRSALLVSSFLEAEYPFTAPDDGPTVFQSTRQAYVSAREADLPIGVVREADGIPDDLGLILVPSTKQLTTPTWHELRVRARAGATVYASYFNGAHGNQRGAWWPKLDELFGVEKRLQYGLVAPVLDDTVDVTFTTAFGGIDAGATFTFPVGGNEHSRSFLPVVPTTAEVLAVDGAGNPFLLRERVGDGWYVLCTYPVEHFAATVARSNPEPTWEIYRALAVDAGVSPAVSVADPRVLTGELVHDDGRRFVWFVSETDAALSASPVLATGTLVDLDGAPMQTVEIAPWDVVVAELR